MMSEPTGEVRRMRVIGVPISVVNMKRAVDTICSWARDDRVRTVFVRDCYGLMRAKKDPVLLAMHDDASLVIPDGIPLTWVGRLRGHGERIGRTPGADVMEEVCARSVIDETSHYFFGGKPGIAERVAERLRERFPGIRVAGIYGPPMRDIDGIRHLGPDELAEIEAIRATSPDFIWIGLSSPKQEYWMMKAAPLFSHGVFLGVGAAFDFHSGAVARAPAFMRAYGLEWLHRLCSEPRRLWRRYLVIAPEFALRVLVESIGLRCRRGAADDATVSSGAKGDCS